MSARCTLGICDGSGWIDDEQTRSVTPCRCRPQLVATRRVSALAGTIPKRYRDVSFDRPPVSDMPAPQLQVVRRFARSIDERLDEGRGLWFFGGVGTGKTTLAMLVSKSGLDAGRTVAIYSLPHLLAVIRSTFESAAQASYAQLLERLTAVDLLQIDGVRTVSRLEEMCEMVPLFGRDHRRVEATDLRDQPPGGGPAADLRLA